MEEASADHAIGISKEGSEDSGWTLYIDYFWRRERGLKSGGTSDQTTRSYSTVSDAASAAAWKPVPNHADQISTPTASRRLNFNRTKAQRILDEDPLEDTASSLICSPKPAEQKDNSPCNWWNGENKCAESRPQARNTASRFAGENKCAVLNDRGDASLPVSLVGW